MSAPEPVAAPAPAPAAPVSAAPVFDNAKVDELKLQATDKVQELYKKGKDKLDQYVRFGGNPKVDLELRKHLDIRIPMAPSIRVTVGTDACLQPQGDSNKYEFVYEPNFNWGITETWFNGQIEVNTADKQIKYAKTFDLDAIALKVNGVFDYDKNVPYVGFKVLTKPGVSSAAGDSSGFSVCKTISQNIGPLTLSADIASSVALGEQTYNPSKKSMESSPAQVEFNAVKLILEA